MNRIPRRAGLTLIELTVVLLILVALAGLLVPYLAGYLERAHGASTADNIAEITKSWELFRVKFAFNRPFGQTNPGYPNRLDSLLETGGAAVYSQLPGGLSGALTPLTLDATQQASLNDAGMTDLYDHKPAAAFPAAAPFVPSATFDGDTLADTHYAALRTAPRSIGTTAATGVAQINSALVANQLNADPAGTYVAFGVGGRCTAVGAVMADAPLHFSDADDPNDVYQRFVVVFQIPAAGAGGFKARFVGVLGTEGEGLGAHLSEFFNAP